MEAAQLAFEAAAKRLVSELEDEESVLRQSGVGAAYLRNVVVFAQSRSTGLLQLFPQVRDQDRRFWEKTLDEHLGFVILVTLVLCCCCCCWSCRRSKKPPVEPAQARGQRVRATRSPSH